MPRVYRHWERKKPLPDLNRGGDEPYLKGARSGKTHEFYARDTAMADDKKTSPAEFIRQVQTEGRKVVWPTREETVRTAIFVFILTVILSLFFLGVDSAFSAIMRWLLTLA